MFERICSGNSKCDSYLKIEANQLRVLKTLPYEIQLTWCVLQWPNRFFEFKTAHGISDKLCTKYTV